MFKEKIKQAIAQYEQTVDAYPMLKRCCSPMYEPTAEVIGRDTSELRKALRNKEKANVILLADPGNGKSTMVSGFAWEEASVGSLTLSVSTEQLVTDNDIDKDIAMQKGLMTLVDEVKQYALAHNIIINLFIDEFHRIVMTSPSAVEVMKPILEKSASNGFRIIAATTFEEYDEWIAPNRALDQRFLRITLPELSKTVVLKILESRAKYHGVYDLAEPSIFEDIYDVSKQILISNAQPRASLDVLNTMIGHIVKSEEFANGRLVTHYYSPEEVGRDYVLDRSVLNTVIQGTYGIDIDNTVDVNDIRAMLKSNLFDQDQAIEEFMRSLEMIWCGFGDPTRPLLSFISVGQTGTGKAVADYEKLPAIVNGQFQIVRHGQLKVDDYVFNRLGQPKKVIGVYPQGKKQVYRVILTDGRFLDVCEDHLWAVRECGMLEQKVRNTKWLYRKYLFNDKRFEIPKHHPLQIGDDVLYTGAFLPDYVEIETIEKLNVYTPMTCIQIDDDEHLYQMANGMVTHNTELAKLVSESMGIPLKRFDMSRYSRPEDAVIFADALAQAAWSAPNAYILIDEVEKSTREAMNILLQVLDDARLTSAKNANRVISFTGNIINLTTNLGSDISEHRARFTTDTKGDLAAVYASLSKSDTFETAVLGRLDTVLIFNKLEKDTMIRIAEKTLIEQLKRLKDPRPIKISQDIIPFIIEDQTSESGERGGARDAKRNVRNLALQVLASHISQHKQPDPCLLHLRGKARFKNRSIIDVDSAHIDITDCYPFDAVNGWLAMLNKKFNKSYPPGRYFVPKMVNGEVFDGAAFARELLNTTNGAFDTDISDDTFVIRSVVE